MGEGAGPEGPLPAGDTAALEAGPEALLRAFAGPGEVPTWRWTREGALPAAARALLAHDGHMTLRLEAEFGAPLGVRVLGHRREGPVYTRKVQLLAEGGHVVQLAIVRVDLAVLPEPARALILSGEVPVGRALVAHAPERRLEVAGFVEFDPAPSLAAELGQGGSRRPAHGRLVRIAVAGRPAIEALEIVAV